MNDLIIRLIALVEVINAGFQTDDRIHYSIISFAG